MRHVIQLIFYTIPTYVVDVIALCGIVVSLTMIKLTINEFDLSFVVQLVLMFQ